MISSKGFRKRKVLLMIKVGIIGATGYAGAELVRILYNHKMPKLSGMAQEAM